MKLDLGCGQSKKFGFVGVDLAGAADVVLDLERDVWPWEICSIDEIWCSHYVEHVADLIGFMNRCWAVLKPGGVMTINAPYYTSIRAHSDPDHKRLITEETFNYFDKDWRKAHRMDHTRTVADFEVLSRAMIYTPEFGGGTRENREFVLKHYWNVVSDIQIKLRKRVD